MAMTKELKDLLISACKDKKYKNNELFDYVLKIYDSHEAKEKIQVINLDLVEQRKKSKEENIKFKAEHEELKNKFDELEKNNVSLTEEEKKLLDKGMSDEVKGIINSMNGKLKTNDEALINLTQQLKLSNDNTKKAELLTKKENVKNILMESLSKVNIKDNNKMNTALSIISSNDMVDIQDDKVVFSYKENGVPFTFDNVDEMTNYIAKEHQYLVDASKNKGGGSNYFSNNNNDNNNKEISYLQENNVHVTRNQQVQNAVERFDKYFK